MCNKPFIITFTTKKNKMKNITTIADLFLFFLEQYGSPYIRKRVKKIKLLMSHPDWVEFFNIALVDLMGYPVQIKETTLDKGVDYIIDLFENDIEETQFASEEDKRREQTNMHAFMAWYRDTVKRELMIRGRLLK